MNDTPTTTLLFTPITEPILPDLVAEILSHSPWVDIPGTFNSRTLSGNVRKNYIFRSGTLENVREEGLERIKELGVSVVVDLRSGRERVESPEVEFGVGVRGIWCGEQEQRKGVGKGEETVSSFCFFFFFFFSKSSHAFFHVQSAEEKKHNHRARSG